MPYKRKAIQWKYPELKHDNGFGGDFYIANEGEPHEIFEWRTDKYPKPTEAELQQWYNEFSYFEKRKYPDWPKQLAMMFDELKETGTISKDGNWYKAIQAVKDAAPKGEK